MNASGLSPPAHALNIEQLRWLLLALALSACPEPTQPSAATTACSKAYDKCELASGVLGVCNPVDCNQGAPGPCFVCRSQH